MKHEGNLASKDTLWGAGWPFWRSWQLGECSESRKMKQRTFISKLVAYTRHGICQNVLHQWDSQNVQFYPKKCVYRQFWQTIYNVGCFSHLFWTNCQSFCKFLLKYKVNPVILGKTRLNLANFTEKEFFALVIENFTQVHKYFTQVPLEPLVTNSMFRRGCSQMTWCHVKWRSP